MDISQILDTTEPGDYTVGEQVSLHIYSRTDLGFKAIVNDKHWGLLFTNEVFQSLSQDQKITGYIKHIREDGKLDLTLQKIGHHAGADIEPLILNMLKEQGGFLEINDKTPADDIYRLFGVSKKKYKVALGSLYKKRLISVSEEGIKLLK